MSGSTGIYGLFETPELAPQAVDGLRAAGIRDKEITIQSSEPLEEYEFGARDRDTVMTWIAVLGALIGLTVGYYLTSITQRSWPVVTGGMPIVTNWSNLIIIFELTMLGAVFASVLDAPDCGWNSRPLAEVLRSEVSMGKILIGVASPREAGKVERALHASQPAGIRKIAL